MLKATNDRFRFDIKHFGESLAGQSSYFISGFV